MKNKVISEFIKYLESGNCYYRLCGLYEKRYDKKIFYFMADISDNKIWIRHNNEELEYFLNLKGDIKKLNIEELRKYLFYIFFIEIYENGTINENIENGNLLYILKTINKCL